METGTPEDGMTADIQTLPAANPDEIRLAAYLGAALTIVYGVLLSATDAALAAIITLPLLALFLLLHTSLELTLAMMVLSLFWDHYFGLYSSAVLCTIPLVLSLVFRFRTIPRESLNNPLTLPLAVWGLCMLPSFVNAARPAVSVLMLFNVVAFIIVAYAIVIGTRTRRIPLVVFLIFLSLTVVNGLFVAAESLMEGLRSFGPAGIMFVDYAGLGICISTAAGLMTRGVRRGVFLTVALFLVGAAILTQTRNIWIGVTLSLAILIVYLWRMSDFLDLTRKFLVVTFTAGLILVAGLATVLVSYAPAIERRVTLLMEEEEYGVDKAGLIRNSLVTRALIWDTAWNAFTSHPIAGIGVYAFPTGSQPYSRIPRKYYNIYVRGLSPHQTHLAVLAETGIVGAFGYAFFMITLIRVAFGTVRAASAGRDRQYSVVAMAAVIYCTVSMMLTDAWLWGQGIVLLGMVTGTVLAMRKIASQPQEAEHRS